MADHYFSKKPTSALTTTTVSGLLRGNQLSFVTGSGVFSKTKIDKGTEVLVKYAEIEGSEKLLDLGCGYGVVGISMKRAYPDLDVTCADVNQRAIMLARRNAGLNKTDIDVLQSDGFEKIKGTFDAILLNPPQTAGKKICLRLIDESFEHLKKGGNLQIVARHNKGGKSLSEYMEELFGNVRVVKIKSGYRVYFSEKEK